MTCDHSESGLFISQNGHAIERVSMKGIELSLLTAGEGTEIIHHKLFAGSRWAMVPEAGWTALEYIYVLTGQLNLDSSNGKVLLRPGDSLSAHPIRKHTIFLAEMDTEFLYVSSQPVFHYYSQLVKEQMDLAVSVEQKDGYTADHCKRIMNLSTMMGEHLGLSSQELLQLNFGSFLHDVGKVKVPESVLCKPGKLTAEEWKIMKSHTIFGREMLYNTGIPVLRSAAIIVEQHHERFDSSGYPFGITGKDITIGAAIVAVVDSYDAMTSDRVYHKGRSSEEALNEIHLCRDTLYHPEVVDAFLSLADKFV